MSDCLIIVESPTKVKTIKKFLDGSFDVEATVGHIRDLPTNQLGVDIERDFKPRYVNITGKADVISNLKKQAAKAKQVYIASDPDREGEAIAWHTATILGIDPASACRITFNEITGNAVGAALKEPRAIDMNLVDAQQTRRILDRIVGYKISPILWSKVQKGLSAGRVQSVAVRMICDRENEIKAFEPKEYWTITANLSKEGDKLAFEAKYYGENGHKKALPNREAVDKVLTSIEGKDFVVTGVKKGTKTRTPAPPFTTSVLQQDASRKFGFTSARTMQIAQQLYEGLDIKGLGSTGLVTYIRTDSTRIADEARTAGKEIILKTYGKEYLPAKDRFYKNKNGSQNAHEAIRPSHLDLKPEDIRDSLTSEQYKLYKLIWDRFLASLMASATYDTMQVDIDCNGNTFKASGSKVTFPGYLAIYEETTDDAKEDDDTGVKLPKLETGDKLNLNKIEDKQNFTQPPQRYTEATLIKAMEEDGIGRPSTYAPTIATIVSRTYIERDKKYLVPTELGAIVNDFMVANFADIVDKGFTADMENTLDSISEGNANWKEILKDFYGPFASTLLKAQTETAKVEIKEEVSDVVCEKCGRNMVVKTGRNGKFLACPGYPACKNSKPLRIETGAKCPKCGGVVLERTTQKGKKYLVCENGPKCDYMEWGTVLANKTCPTCGSFMVTSFFKRRRMIKCGNPACETRVKDATKEVKDESED